MYQLARASVCCVACTKNVGGGGWDAALDEELEAVLSADGNLHATPTQDSAEARLSGGRMTRALNMAAEKWKRRAVVDEHWRKFAYSQRS
jgi:hypothetical protein